MKRVVLVAAALALSGGPAFAVPATSTTTSMGRPTGSPSEVAPRSARVPGTPANEHALALGKNPSKVASCGSFHPAKDCDRPTPSSPPAK
jgi:hypothetical protein